MPNISDQDIVTHPSPAWRSNANFLIHADIAEEGYARKLEQLWCKKVGDRRFVICCIPFFLYNLSLGDEVLTTASDNFEYTYEKVVLPSGYRTFRIWFGDPINTPSHIRSEIANRLTAMGAAVEWHTDNLVAIAVQDGAELTEIINRLNQLQIDKMLIYEPGKI